jgi:hypothetical protein
MVIVPIVLIGIITLAGRNDSDMKMRFFKINLGEFKLLSFVWGRMMWTTWKSAVPLI